MTDKPETTNQAPNPWLLGRGMRWNQYEHLRIQLRRSNALCLALFGLLVALSVLYQVQAGRKEIAVFVHQVDRHGSTLAFGPLQEQGEPSRAVLVRELSEFVIDLRTVTSDPFLQRKAIWDAQAATAGRARKRLPAWYREHPPFERVEEGTVHLQVETALPFDAAMRRWQVEWTEHLYSVAGQKVGEEPWTGIFSIEIDPSGDPEERRKNLHGIYVADFEITRRITTPGDGS